MPALCAKRRILGSEPDADGGLEAGGDCEDQPALVAVASGDRARERVEDDVLDALADRGGNLIVFEIRDEARELGGRSGGLSGDWSSGGHGRISDQSSFAPESFTAFDHLPISDLTSAVNSSGVEIAGSAARPISFSRISGCR